jgi:ABC-type phosphate transport system substrate-binding protein
MKNLAVVAALFVGVVTNSAHADAIRIGGSTTFTSELMAPHQSEVERLSKQTIILLPNRSNLGVYGLFEGNDLAMISSSWPDMLLELKKQRPNLPYDRLRVFNVAKTRVAFSVNQKNVVHYADLKALGRVLKGELTSWKELGGADLPIHLVMVREGGGVQASIEARLHLKIASARAIRVQISSQVNKIVEQLPEALGLAQIENLGGSKAVELKTDLPIEQELNLVTLDDPSPGARAVINAVMAIATKQGIESQAPPR